MHIVRWIVGATVFIALLFLSLQNSAQVELAFFNLASFKAPLIVVVFVAFTSGVAIGLLAGALRGARLKRQIKALRREQRGLQDPSSVTPGAVAPGTSPASGPGFRPRRPYARWSLVHSGPSAHAGTDPTGMDFELWWLLPIPAIFFGLGWIAARIDIKHLLRESRALPLSYFRGLNFLLNEQPDKAIESFIEVVKVDPQTIDLHFALGSLFRRQGEIERAIRMHQNLLDRVDLPADKRGIATYELAQDFHRAGLLDRAEELFTKLDGTTFEHSALSHLISIYETEKDWTKAITAMQRMEELAKQPYFKEIAQYHCELAQAALLKADDATVQAELEKAFATYRGCTRATLLLGDLEAQQGRAANALVTWQKIETQNPAFLSLAADRFADTFRKQGDTAQGIRVLRNYQAQYPSLDLLNALFTLVLEQEGPEAAAALIKDELARNPTLLGLDRLLEAQLLAAPADRRHDLELVKGLVSQHIKRLGMYKCDNCGFRAKQYYWRCPGCLKWETYSPRRTETPDGYA